MKILTDQLAGLGAIGHGGPMASKRGQGMRRVCAGYAPSNEKVCANSRHPLSGHSGDEEKANEDGFQ